MPSIAPPQPLQHARRRFLARTGSLAGTLAAGSTLALLAPSTAWSLDLHVLTNEEGAALLALGRTLYPQAKLPDAVYAVLVKDLDTEAAADAATATLLRDGLHALDAATGGYARATPAQRLAALRAIERGPFFAKVRGQCIRSLYDNTMTFAALGYQGSSWQFGGYLRRGFQDLTWLPAPPLSASPKPYTG